MTQAEAAVYHSMPLGAYKLAEADQPQPWAIPKPTLGALELHESCLIMRRRKGLTLAKLAPMIGISKWWLCLMERGDAPVARIANYWA